MIISSLTREELYTLMWLMLISGFLNFFRCIITAKHFNLTGIP